ncbi:TonB-dependent receptor [Urechidicola sp. KH5]
MKNNLLKKMFFVAFMLTGSVIFAQTVSGTVSDSSGPLPGANVVVKGTTNGVTTDFDGKYTLDNVPSDAVLVFSFIGYAAQEVAVAGQSTVDVTLEEDSSELDEVVVFGYTAQTRGDVTGSVASVDLDEALKAPVANAGEALQGRVTGVTVTNSGAPGAAPKIVIRGLGTTNNTDPLYIIDGVQTTDANVLNSINPADIEQMNVLKDGAAAIYGSRGANGVVIVTTKSGGYNLAGTSLTVDMYAGMSRAANLPDNLNAQQHGDMIWQSLLNDGATLTHPQYGNGASPVVPATLNGLPVPVTVNPNGTNWIDEVTRAAPTQNISLSMESGSENGKYLMSVNYFNREGIIKHTGFERVTTKLNSEFKIKDIIRIGEHLNVAYSNGNSGDANAIEVANRSSPLLPVRDDNGDFAGPYSNSTGLSNAYNPYASLYRGRDNFSKSMRVFGDVYLEADLGEDFTFRTSYGVSLNNVDYRNFNALDPESAEPRSTNTLTEGDQSSFEWTWTNTLVWQKSFGDHNINAVIGLEAVEDGGRGKEVSRNGYLFENPDFYNLSTGSSPANINFAYEYNNTLFSYFFNANYDYAGKYFASVTVRNDKSSRFRGSNKSQVFPSFSAGWLISGEDFWNDDAFVNRLKLKASYGKIGNQVVPGSNPTLNIFNLNEQFGNYAINGSSIATGAVLGSFGNEDLKWETSNTTNIGIEADFLDNKLSAGLEWYQIVTSDLIAQDFSLVSATAIDAAPPYVNLGEMKNTGIDFNLGYNNTWDNGLSLNASANISHYKNEVVDLVSAFQLGNGGFRGGAVTRTEVGESISQFYGRVVTGIDNSGRFTYKDVNGDGTINDEDRTYIGSPHPDFVYGLNFTLNYKGFDMALFFNGSQGNDIYNYQKIYTDFPTFFNGNRSTRVLDSWTPNNTDASLPALSASIRNNETDPNSHFVEDGSYFRLKNLQIGYTFPNEIAEKLSMQSLRIYATGTNLFTITGYDGIDPEIVSYDNLTLGVDNQIYPVSQIYTFGINLKF